MLWTLPSSVQFSRGHPQPETEFETSICYHSFSEPQNVFGTVANGTAGPQVYLQPAKTKSQHFGGFVEILVWSWKYCR